jgi:hypothetical protein
VLAQLSGALAATVFSAWLFELPPRSTAAPADTRARFLPLGYIQAFTLEGARRR